jgi:hypothetical protein
VRGGQFALSPYNTMVQYLIMFSFRLGTLPETPYHPRLYWRISTIHTSYIELGSVAGFGTSAALTMR